MTWLAVGIFWVLVGLVVGQGFLVSCFVWALARPFGGILGRTPGSEQFCPKTAVIVCLRGTDPFLAACLEALLDQDYPEYDVRVVVDCREDPAWEVVEEVVRRRCATNVRIAPLTERRQTCSLKCSSVHQGISGLDGSHEVVALLDADTVPHRTWLRELVAPLADPRVGVTTGNRWYMPAQGAWGALVRYLWNAAAVVQMCCYRIPWGGTLALKMEVVREAGLLDRWARAFCEDTMLYRILRQRRLRVAFVPSLIMVNREACSIRGFFGWVRRQLLTARLYHPGWPAVVAHGITISLAQLAAIGLLLLALATGSWEAAAWTGFGLAGYLAAMLLMLLPMEACVRRIVRARGEPADWLSGRTALRVLAAIPLTQVIYFTVLISAMLVRTVDWRGVSYRVDGPWEIGMVRYRPFEPREAFPDDTASL